MSFKIEVGTVVVNCVFGNDHSKQLIQQKPTKQQFKFVYIFYTESERASEKENAKRNTITTATQIKHIKANVNTHLPLAIDNRDRSNGKEYKNKYNKTHST